MPLPDGSPPFAPGERLDSWKEIAAYLNRGLSTVQRWEHDESLPVHRLQHGKGGSVFAYRHELDEWWTSRGSLLDNADVATPKPKAQSPSPDSPRQYVNPATRRLFIVLAVVLLVGAMAAGARWLKVPSGGAPAASRASSSAAQRLVLPLPSEYPLVPMSRMPSAGLKPALAISPDGGVLVYSAFHDHRMQLVAYDMSTKTVSPLAGAEEGHTPFFSPDGRRLGFIARGKLWVTETAGGTPEAIADASNGWGAAWGADEAIYYSPIEWGGLLKVDLSTGRAGVFSVGGSMPEPLSPGLGLLATVPGNQVALIRDGMVVRPLVAGFAGRLLEPGYLLYARPGKLVAVGFDEQRAEVTGSAVVLAGDLRTGPYAVGQFAVSREDTVVYVSGQDSLLARFVGVSPDGRRTPLPLPQARYSEFSVTPDGTRLAATVYADTPDRYMDLVVFDLARAGTGGAVGSLIPRPDDMPDVSPLFPKWDTDGHHLFYGLRGEAQSWLAWSTADGSDFRILWGSGTDGAAWLYPMSFSPDGQWLAAFGPSPGSRMDLYVFRIRDADGSMLDTVTPVPYVTTPALESFPQFSPSGKVIAYASDTSGRYEVYVSGYPDAGTPCHVSHDTAFDPTWTSGGREIVYHSNTSMYARSVESLAECRFGPPRLLFDGFPDRPGFGHDVLPGGEWLMLESDDYDRPTTLLHVLTHVHAAIRRRANGTSPAQ